MVGSEVYGVLASLGSSLALALGFLIWEAVWKKARGSAFSLNLIKCNLASVGFLILGFSIGFVTDVNWKIHDIGYLILSGFIGIIIGDLFWLEALTRIGAVPVLVIDTVKPFSAAMFGWFVFKEPIQKIAYAGLSLTAIGILLVSYDHENRIKSNPEKSIEITELFEPDVENSNKTEERKITQSNDYCDISKTSISCNHELHINIERESLETTITEKSDDIAVTYLRERRLGYVFAVSNVILDTYGSVLTKQHGTAFTNPAINLIRFGTSGIFMILIVIVMKLRQRSENLDIRTSDSKWFQIPRLHIKEWLKIGIGIGFVTFICPSLSNYALFKISLYLALSLGSTSPLFGFLIEWIMCKRPTLIGIIGAISSVGGVVILAMYGLK